MDVSKFKSGKILYKEFSIDIVAGFRKIELLLLVLRFNYHFILGLLPFYKCDPKVCE